MGLIPDQFSNTLLFLSEEYDSSEGCKKMKKLIIVIIPKIVKLCNNFIALQQNLDLGCKIQAPSVFNNRGLVIVKAASHGDGTVPESPIPSSDSNEASVPVESLPLESKLQLKLQQKMRMKMAKKIRLRRKRLVRKTPFEEEGTMAAFKVEEEQECVNFTSRFLAALFLTTCFLTMQCNSCIFG
ncbi:hypothetical protein Salat_0964400 [Sesamum alatum]|uniref:Uncharacterized protein n=1 Tax=Sesamum alatum TaxID=300844 RepID=A0AAE1YL77_9LAMI|nr:hypothetical protein Salat_0964400 [Sesamum alatum]